MQDLRFTGNNIDADACTQINEKYMYVFIFQVVMIHNQSSQWHRASRARKIL